jgi:hypothetical protein
VSTFRAQMRELGVRTRNPAITSPFPHALPHARSTFLTFPAIIEAFQMAADGTLPVGSVNRNALATRFAENLRNEIERARP